DGRNAGAGDQTGPANIVANNIDLDANGGGNIGSVPGSTDAVGNDLKIDSSNLVTGRVGAEADGSIYLTETVLSMNVLLAQALNGNVRLTVRDSGVQGEDLNLIHPSNSVFADQNESAILIVENAPRTITVANPNVDPPSIN